jgi:hypothetical protein
MEGDGTDYSRGFANRLWVQISLAVAAGIILAVALHYL